MAEQVITRKHSLLFKITFTWGGVVLTYQLGAILWASPADQWFFGAGTGSLWPIIWKGLAIVWVACGATIQVLRVWIEGMEDTEWTD